MKHALILAAAALVVTTPAVAKPGNGHGKGRAFDPNREMPERGFGQREPVGYGVDGCPPGLAKKNNGCMPPGQAKKRNGDQSVANLLRLGNGRRR